MNEKLLIRLLPSPPNVNYLKKYITHSFNISDFKYICSEFPILLGDNYGYLDIFGIEGVEDGSNPYFFEAKLDRPGIREVAKNECIDYEIALSRFGLFQDDLIRLFRRQ
jgi:hypothetical protein